jgi:two-component system, sensor histidine kinase and response regulator
MFENPMATTQDALSILVVDDNPLNQKIAQLLLKHLGFEADQVASGAEALMAIVKTSYDVIFMDVQMPHMDGLETTRHIRRRFPGPDHPKIIAITADGEKETCLDAGMNDHITKPLTLEALKKVFTKVDADCRKREK